MENIMPQSLMVAVTALALLVTAQSSSAQPIPAVTPNALAAQLQANGIDTAPGSGKRQALNCVRGSAKTDWAYHCVASLADGAPGMRATAVEIMIFNDSYDFASRDAQIKAAVVRLNGRWSLDYEPEMSIKGEGRTISLKGACHQSRGATNSPAYCLLPVARNVLVFSQVAPAQASSDEIATSQKGESDSFNDMANAGTLASFGAVAVVQAQQIPDKINNASDSLLK
jgi:hypothetical protein